MSRVRRVTLDSRIDCLQLKFQPRPRPDQTSSAPDQASLVNDDTALTKQFRTPAGARDSVHSHAKV